MYKVDDLDYPCEQLIELEGEPHYLGRIVIYKHQTHYDTEICIVHRESRKIFHFIATLYSFCDPQEALDSSVQRLSLFLSQGRSSR